MTPRSRCDWQAGAAQIHLREEVLVLANAVIGRQGPLRYTDVAVEQVMDAAVIGRQGPLRYTLLPPPCPRLPCCDWQAGAAQIHSAAVGAGEVIAVIGRQGPLRYTITPVTLCENGGFLCLAPRKIRVVRTFSPVLRVFFRHKPPFAQIGGRLALQREPVPRPATLL